MPGVNDNNLNVVTEVGLIYRNKTKASERPQITTSKEAYDILSRTWDENKIELVEQFKIVLLDRRNSVLGISTISTGGITACVVDLRVAFATALKARATGLILTHNHPSGVTTPSNEDITLTRKFESAAKVLDINLLDHVIVTKDSYLSFADEGLMATGT